MQGAIRSTSLESIAEYVFVCIHCVHTWETPTHTHKHTYTYIHTPTHTHTQTYIHIHTPTHTHTNIHTHTYMHPHKHKQYYITASLYVHVEGCNMVVGCCSDPDPISSDLFHYCLSGKYLFIFIHIRILFMKYNKNSKERKKCF